MSKFSEELFVTKTVSVWGIGYLGYTTILRLQSKGFFVNCSTFDKDVQKDIVSGKYPYESMKQTWSQGNDIPKIDLSKVSFCHDYKKMFEANVHIIALPAFGGEYGKPEVYDKLVDVFIKNTDKLVGSLVLFQSAEKVGTVENYFVKPLKKVGAKCHFASAFRSDWSVEEFLLGSENRIIAANDKDSLDVASEFFDILDVKFKTLSTIEEAEVYENAKNCLKYSAEAFFTQLSFAYPAININEVSAMIVKNLDLSAKRNGINLLSHKHILHIEHVLAGQNGDYLSIIKETQAVNMTTVLFYADILKQKKISSVTVMGLSTEGARKDIRASAAVLLAEYLYSIGIKVFVHDPYFTKDEIKEIFPFAKMSSMKNKADFTDGYVVMGVNPVYSYFTQKDVNENGISNSKIIIDSIGTLKHLSFSSKTIYHEVGDGGLKALLK
jgi:UDP-N-acetyl-D-mannosaminuronate dehydrogenase